MHRVCLAILSLATGWLAPAPWAYGQSIETLSNGLKQFSQGPLTLVTDLPIDAELKQWPMVLEQAIEIWRRQWNVPDSKLDDLHLTAYLIGDRSRFQSAGVLDDLPAFEDGYQFNNSIYLVEQPSLYYRRHLFLHEATHWIMYRWLGGAGSPWFMEGMADLYGTHRWEDGKLTLGVIPGDASQVPHWGRFNRLHAMLDRGDAPTLKEILAYQNNSSNRMDRYVWSWAACVFFNNHPNYRTDLASASQPPLEYDLTLSNHLRDALENQLPTVVADWNGFLTDFDFGYDPKRSMVSLGQTPPSKFRTTDAPRFLEIDTSRGWQASGISMTQGQAIEISAEGSYFIATFPDGRSWRCEPQGITLRYEQHEPLGRLIASIVPLNDSLETRTWTSTSVGRHAILTAPCDGVLMLKINEAAGGLADNEGNLKVTLQPVRP